MVGVAVGGRGGGFSRLAPRRLSRPHLLLQSLSLLGGEDVRQPLAYLLLQLPNLLANLLRVATGVPHRAQLLAKVGENLLDLLLLLIAQVQLRDGLSETRELTDHRPAGARLSRFSGTRALPGVAEPLLHPLSKLGQTLLPDLLLLIVEFRGNLLVDLSEQLADRLHARLRVGLLVSQLFHLPPHGVAGVLENAADGFALLLAEVQLPEDRKNLLEERARLSGTLRAVVTPLGGRFRPIVARSGQQGARHRQSGKDAQG
jgi:hypothetical protein